MSEVKEPIAVGTAFEALHAARIPGEIMRESEPHEPGLEVVPEFARHGQRIEEQQPLSVVDRVGRHVLAPRLGRPPLRVGCLPVPQARTQLAHGTMLLKRCALPMRTTVDARVGCRWRDRQATEQPIQSTAFGK